MLGRAPIELPGIVRIPAPTLAAVVAVILLGTVGAVYAMRRPIGQLRRRLAAEWHRLEAIRVAPGALVNAAILAAAVWVLDMVRLWLVVSAFATNLGVLQVAALVTITIVAGWVPTLGGLGVIEGGLAGGLMAFGVGAPDAVAITAVERGISYGLATIAGGLSMAALGGRSLWNAIRLDPAVAESAGT
jgi:uncharacterized membrane protein YbhN (UPF0104 family)